VARRAVRWTEAALTRANRDYLSRLPQGPIEVAPGLFVCHGSPLDEDQYVISLEDAAGVFSNHAAKLTFFGHTHLPSCFSSNRGRLTSLTLEGSAATIELESGSRYLANPGSVGQPRDRDPRAAYFVYDAKSKLIDWRRCDYSIESAQRRILEAGLPEVLAHRLAVGV
jgi:diadenosine tetraphosphatase ApaH/serine/threonine PP2A family protein phosphatase